MNIMRSHLAAAVMFHVAACIPQPHSTNKPVECTTKAHAKYDGTSAKQIEERLKQESARVSWEAVPEPHRAWAAEHLDAKLSAAGVTLAASASCKEIEAAASKIAGLGKRIGEVAKQCTAEQCGTKSAQASEMDATLDAAICPLFPFC